MALATLALCAAACGASTGHPSSTGTATSTTVATSTTSAGATAQLRLTRPRPRPRGARVGATQRVHAGGSTLSVTVSRVLDPLRGSGARLLRGMRAIGVLVSIADDSGATYDSTASGDWSLITTAGPATPLLIKRGPCQTQLVDFESLIGAGETRGGCVAFSAPSRADVLQVRFSPHSRARGRVAWR
ncbi:MAG: hypothetical protein ACRDMX_01495 [Solirubrobacteraceae bacterium]